MTISNRVMNEFTVGNLIISKDEFCSLMRSAKKWTKIGFIAWTINTETEWDFSQISISKISAIAFSWSGK